MKAEQLTFTEAAELEITAIPTQPIIITDVEYNDLIESQETLRKIYDIADNPKLSSSEKFLQMMGVIAL